MQQVQVIPISKIIPNPDNPRTVTDDKFKKLVKSLTDFPEMLEKRPLICVTTASGKFMVLGGNQRLKAAIKAGIKQLPVMLADDWSEEKRQEFVVKDNLNFGDWSWELLKTDWNEEQLIEWGLEMPEDEQPFENVNYSGKNKEIDVSEFKDEMTIKLTYTETEYWQVKEALAKIAATPEQAIFSLLNL